MKPPSPPIARLAISLAIGLAACAALLLVDTRTVEGGPVVCIFKLLTGHDCPGCGTTRAFSHIAHGRLADAMRCNRLVIITFPLAAGIWCMYMYKTFIQLKNSLRSRQS